MGNRDKAVKGQSVQMTVVSSAEREADMGRESLPQVIYAPTGKHTPAPSREAGAEEGQAGSDQDTHSRSLEEAELRCQQLTVPYMNGKTLLVSTPFL